jgi:Serine hydrolase (FSH1)
MSLVLFWQEMVDIIDKAALLRTPSLHIMGQADPLLPESKVLKDLYVDSTSRIIMMHEEGHNVPSIRTNLYPAIQRFLVDQNSKTA